MKPETPMESKKRECCGLCEKHVRDRTPIGRGSSRRIMTGVHLECKKPSCPCHSPKDETTAREGKTNGACVIGKHEKCPVSNGEYRCNCSCHSPREEWREEVKNILARIEFKTSPTGNYGEILREPDLTELESFIEKHLSLSYTRGREDAVKYIQDEFKQNRSYDSAKAVFNVSHAKMDDILTQARSTEGERK